MPLFLNALWSRNASNGFDCINSSFDIPSLFSWSQVWGTSLKRCSAVRSSHGGAWFVCATSTYEIYVYHWFTLERLAVLKGHHHPIR